MAALGGVVIRLAALRNHLPAGPRRGLEAEVRQAADTTHHLVEERQEWTGRSRWRNGSRR